MSGRHRKPSTTGKTVAKVAVTGAIMGTAGVAFTGTANAAPDSDWDKLAQCESGGNWGINTGNGYQGGLQFSPSTWSSHGGGEFAATANQASRGEQIAVAERVLANQGWGAWPTCSSNLGLSSAPSQRSAPAPEVPELPSVPAAPALPATPALPSTPALPDLTSVPSTDGSAAALAGITNAVEVLTSDPAVAQFVSDVTANLQLDPQLVSLYEANKNLLPGA